LSRKAAELLGKPFVAARAAAYVSACNCLNEAWQSVYSQFKDRLANKYPFGQYGTDASASDIVEFFGSGGAMDRFYREEVQPAENAGLGLSNAYRRAGEAADRIRRVIAGGRLNVSFTLTARATGFRDMERATFKLGSEELSYSMGSPRSRDFVWSGDEDDDCSLNVSLLDSQQVPPLRESGAWGLFRLLDKADIQGNMVVWTIRHPGDAQYELSGTGANFIKQGHFKRSSCPAKVCGQ
jgi:type VI secretion system protein ImpL